MGITVTVCERVLSDEQLFERAVAALADPRNYRGNTSSYERHFSTLQRVLTLDGADIAYVGSEPIIVSKSQVTRKSNIDAATEEAKVHLMVQDARRVFVVHGRDKAFNLAMNEFLRSVALQPIQWSEAVALTEKSTPYTFEVIQAALKVSRAIIVLLTPDSETKLRNDLWADDEPKEETEQSLQPRQNVLYEAGLAFGLAATRTILVKATHVRIASDLDGLNYVPFSGDPGSRNDLINRLITAGCDPERSGEDWLRSGSFPSYRDVTPSGELPRSSTTEKEAAAQHTLSQSATTLRAAAFALSHDIRLFLKDVPEGLTLAEEFDAVFGPFNDRFWERFAAIHDRLKQLYGPRASLLSGPGAWYPKSKQNVNDMAARLDKAALEVPDDVPF